MTFGEVQIKQLSLVAIVDTRGEESVSYSVAVCKHCEEYKRQPSTVYPQTSGLVTITTATSCSSAQQGWYCGHTPECITITVTCMLAAPCYGQFVLCTLQRVQGHMQKL